MEFRIKKLTETAVTPSRAFPEDAGLDISAIEDVRIAPHGGRQLIRTGLAFTCPPGTYTQIASRSGLASKHGVIAAAGVIDRTYTGEVKVLLINTGEQPFEAKAGEKIAQLLVIKLESVEVVEVDSLAKSERAAGGFGSTDAPRAN